ncbi:actin-related protein 8-like [Apostichopus japonicus]|uniref:actin-related protein 8-like n=1 Tax=Stichopus japonicus TaxID=307972 RepID=UPI003AB1ECE1
MDDIGEPEATIVIHPGSYWLRIGRAIDPFPVSVPHVIARRKKASFGQRHEDGILFRMKDGKNQSKQRHMEECVSKVHKGITERMTSSGQPREPVSLSKEQEFNDAAKPRQLDEDSGMVWTDVQSNPEFLVGEKALYLEKPEDYNIHWPVRKGSLNIHKGIGGSLTSVLQDLESIWSTAIENHLSIPRQDLSEYNAILLIPDIYHRPHIKELMNVLLVRMGFGAALVHQESVCASYGSGLSSACVVDVGDHKTAVTCVEDGISHRNTRICLAYGGRDITRCFTWLLERARFPYIECNPNRIMDTLLLIELKETFCHLDQDFDGPQLLDFHVSFPNQPTFMYKMNLGEETMIAPMGLFYPEIFGIHGEEVTFTQQRNQGDPEDIHDEIFLLQTQAQPQQTPKARVGTISPEGGEAAPTLPRSDSPSVQSHPDTFIQEISQPVISRRISSSQEPNRLLGLDQAVHYSIDSCASDETKKKMYGNILVVGGGISFYQGATEMLRHRIQSLMSPSLSKSVEKIEVICKTKDLDPRLICWKGGSVLACLDTTQELWIHQLEWKKHGLKVLRERAPFVW